MRASEFIKEETNNMPDFAEPVMSRFFVMPGMSPYYEYYRFMILTAGEPKEKLPTDGTLRDVPAALAYTKEEMQMISNALKRMGKKGKFVAGPGSLEPTDTQSHSPVPQNSGKIIKRK